MKQRLEYIDALRGLAILLVVFMHVPQYGFGQSIGGYYMEMAILLAVPLFFFISGWCVPLEITPPRPSENGTLRHITVGRAAIATPPEPI